METSGPLRPTEVATPGYGRWVAPVRLVERDEQLQALLAASAGPGCALFLSGEAGSGKTSLILALRDRLDHRHRFRMGRCEPLSPPVPLGPLYEMLPSLPAGVDELLAEGGRRHEVFVTIHDELASERGVFVIDDAHVADDATIELIRYLGRRIGETPTLLVCIHRSAEVDRSHPLRGAIGELADRAVRIELPTLTVAGVTELAKGTGVDPVEVYGLTGGNPLYVSQMLANPGERLPRTAADVIIAQAQRLPPGAWDALDAVALSPDGLPLRTVAELDVAGGDAVDKGVALGLLEVDGSRVRCRHALVALAIEENVPPARRVALHGRLAELLASAASSPADIVAVAHHAVRAGIPDLAVDFSLRAGRRARADGSHREAAAHFRDALGFRESMERDVLLDTLEACSYESYLIGRLDQAWAQASEVRRLAGTADRRGRALRWMSRLAWFQGRRDDAVRCGREAVALLEREGHDGHELAFAYSNLSQLAMLDNREVEAEHWGRKASSLAEAWGDVEVVVHALNNLGSSVTSQRSGPLLESLELSLAHGLGEHAARAFCNLGYMRAWQRRLDEAEDHLRRGIDYTEAQDLGTWFWYMRGTRARLHLERGSWEAALADADAVLVTQTVHMMRHDSLVTRARVLMRRGHPEAEEAVADAVAVGAEIGEYLRIVLSASVALEWRWLMGRSLAEELVPRAAEAVRERGDAWGAAELGFWQLRTGEPPATPLAAPIQEDVDGDIDGAITAWRDAGGHLQALILEALSGDEGLIRESFGRLAALDATATLAALRRDLHATGITNLPRGPVRSTRENPAGLTARQMEVLECLAAGMSNAAIAEELFISAKTAEHHVSAVLSKLDASSRTEAVAIARRLGLI